VSQQGDAAPRQRFSERRFFQQTVDSELHRLSV
jgi:hypothetical protein